MDTTRQLLLHHVKKADINISNTIRKQTTLINNGCNVANANFLIMKPLDKTVV